MACPYLRIPDGMPFESFSLAKICFQFCDVSFYDIYHVAMVNLCLISVGDIFQYFFSTIPCAPLLNKYFIYNTSVFKYSDKILASLIGIYYNI